MEVEVLKGDDDRILNAIKCQIMASQCKENAPRFIIIDNITNGFGSILSPTKMKKPYL